MTAIPDVTPVFLIDTAAPPGNVVPALARLLIDMARPSRQSQQKLTREGSLMMLEESPLNPVALWMQPCHTQN